MSHCRQSIANPFRDSVGANSEIEPSYNSFRLIPLEGNLPSQPAEMQVELWLPEHSFER